MGKLVMGRSQFRAHPRRDQQGLLGHVGMAHVGVSWFLLVRLETTMACNTASWKDAAGSAPLNNPHHSRGIHNNAGHLSCKSNVGTRRCKLGVQVDGARSLAKRYPEVGVGLQIGGACGSIRDQVFPAGRAHQLQAVAPWGAGAGWNMNIE